MIDVYNFFKSISEFVSDISIFMYKWQALAGALLTVVASFVILFVRRWIDRENLKKQSRPFIKLEIPFAENDFEKGKRVIDETKQCLCPIKIMNVSNNLALDIVVKVNCEYEGKSCNIDFSKHLIPMINGMTTYSIYLWNTGLDDSSRDSEPNDSIYELSYIKDPKMSVSEFFKLRL